MGEVEACFFTNYKNLSFLFEDNKNYTLFKKVIWSFGEEKLDVGCWLESVLMNVLKMSASVIFLLSHLSKIIPKMGVWKYTNHPYKV